MLMLPGVTEKNEMKPKHPKVGNGFHFAPLQVDIIEHCVIVVVDVIVNTVVDVVALLFLLLLLLLL